MPSNKALKTKREENVQVGKAKTDKYKMLISSYSYAVYDLADNVNLQFSHD